MVMCPFCGSGWPRCWWTVRTLQTPNTSGLGMNRGHRGDLRADSAQCLSAIVTHRRRLTAWRRRDLEMRYGYHPGVPLLPRRPPPLPHEVFTPGSLPLETHNVYAHRQVAEDKLKRYMERRQVPIVFGGYGVGKTTLVKKFFQSEASAGRVIYVPAGPQLTLPDLFARILEVLHYSAETEIVEKDIFKSEGGFDMKIVKATFTGQGDVERKRSLVVTSPTDAGMIKIMSEAELILVVDEMHQCSPSFRSELANLIKALKSVNHRFPTLVLVGTTADAERLVAADPGIDRYIKELAVPLLLPHEARFIVTTGFSKLQVEIDDRIASRVVELAAGAPTIVHALCLEIAESFLERKKRDGKVEVQRVQESDCVEAVRLYLQDHGRRLANIYMKAIETTGTRRYRKLILHAVAACDSDYVTMDDIRERVSAMISVKVRPSALSGPLSALKKDTYGRILQDVERLPKGARIRNLTAFSDPMMKSFVRFMDRLDGAGYMPSARELTHKRQVDQLG